MMRLAPTSQLYIDVRSYQKSQDLSLDLSLHLPRRLAVGPVVVITDNPPVFLSVVRKRLAKLLDHLQYQRARTLDRRKRESLAYEAMRLSTYQFSAKPQAGTRTPDALFVGPNNHLAPKQAPCKTVYITVELSCEQLRRALRLLPAGALLVVYGDWLEGYELAVTEHLRVCS
jgi:hypothetical protein